MSDIPSDVPVSVFDPALPFERVLILDAGVDTWHEHILITNSVLMQLVHLDKRTEKETLRVSGGMSIQVPVVTIGLKIGHIEIPEVKALVLDDGAHALLLGRSIFSEIFRGGVRPGAGKSEEPSRQPESTNTDELRVQLYPVTYPFSSKNLENFLLCQRRIYNVLLIALRRVNASGLKPEIVDSIIESDMGIPDHLCLKISSIESGSVLIALASGCKSALKHLSSLFEKGASARLAQELAEAKDAEVKASISKETRDATALEIRLEKDRLSAQHIHETYQQFRAEARDKLSFLNDLIAELGDPELQGELRRKKDRAILELADQMLVPVVRQVPDAHSVLRSTALALPPPPNWKPGDTA
ncbi:MAG TPA: hypothetical protein VGS22_06670 [Thermoanaerobaculia bacterium]|jgi:hypothetical protein|nr:hypothetical protein [Thermoanaerobaculia bacterium]